MSFLAIIVALVLVQAWGSGGRVHRDEWFYNWQSRVASMGLMAPLTLALAVLAPVVLAEILLDALHPVLFGLLWIGLAVLLLLYSFGRRDFHQLMERYRHQCRSGDFEGALLTTFSELGWASPKDDPGSAEQVNTLVQRSFAYEGYQRWFAVLFYFAVLGPAGALAYRLLQLGRHRFEPEITEQCLFLLDWVPARLLAVTFVVTGDFVNSRDKLLDSIFDPSQHASQLLYRVGTSALGEMTSPQEAADADPQLAFGAQAAVQNRELGSLLQRSAVCWVAVLALLVLFF